MAFQRVYVSCLVPHPGGPKSRRRWECGHAVTHSCSKYSFVHLPHLQEAPHPPLRRRPSSALVLTGLRQEGTFKSPPAVLASTCQVNQENKNEGWTNVLTSETLDLSGPAVKQKLLRNQQTAVEMQAAFFILNLISFFILSPDVLNVSLKRNECFGRKEGDGEKRREEVCGEQLGFSTRLLQ